MSDVDREEPDACATFQTSDAEEVLAAFVARRANIEPPYAYRCRWLWNGSPTVSVSVSRVKDNVRRIRPREPKEGA